MKVNKQTNKQTNSMKVNKQTNKQHEGNQTNKRTNSMKVKPTSFLTALTYFPDTCHSISSSTLANRQQKSS